MVPVRCVSCGSCVDACTHGCYRQNEGTLIRDWSQCAACGDCVEACVYGALEMSGAYRDVREVHAELMLDREFYERSGGGVTASGGEPLIWADFCAALFARLKECGVHTALDTCGAVAWSAFEKVLPVTDLFLYDIKCWDAQAHRDFTGSGNEGILDNLVRLNKTRKEIHIRMPLIRSLNDGGEGVAHIAEFLQPLNSVTRIELLPYHDYGVSKYEGLGLPYQGLMFQPPEEDTLAAIQEQFGAMGKDVWVKRT